MLPQGMFSVALATVLFPALTRFAARGDIRGLAPTTANGMRQIFLLLIPARRSRSRSPRRSPGSSTSAARSAPQSTDLVSTALFWFSFCLPFAGVNLLLTRTFFSLQRPGSRPRLAAASLVVNALVSLALYKPLRDRRPGDRHGRRQRWA